MERSVYPTDINRNSSWNNNCHRVFESESITSSEDSRQASLSSASFTSEERSSPGATSSISIWATHGSEPVADIGGTRTRITDTINDPSIETKVRKTPSGTRLSLEVVKATNHQTKLFPTSPVEKVKDECVKFGRREYCDVRINSEFCSREQFEIGFNGTDFTLTNLSRSTPTLVDGTEVSRPVELFVGDRIQLDDIVVRVAQITISSGDSDFCVSILRKSVRRRRSVDLRVHLKLTNAYLPATAPINILPFSRFDPVYPTGNYAFGGKSDDWGSPSSTLSGDEMH